MVSKYIIDEQTMTDIADGVRWRTGKYDTLSTAEMISELKKDYGVNQIRKTDICPSDGPWVRPSGWPDLDSLNLEMSGDDFIYMTYDADQEASAIVWHIETANRQPAILDIGHIENGIYIADETYTVNHNTDFVKWTDEYSGYLVLRITGQLTYCYAKSTTRDGQTQNHRQQPILERIAWVPHLIKFATAYNVNAWGMYTLEREKTANGDGTALQSLYYAWAYCRRLQDLDISGIHTPNVTSMETVFYSCQMLKTLDLRHWAVDKVTTMASVFSTCYGLMELDLTGWETNSLTNMGSMFNDCRSLVEIRGLEQFNTSKVTSFISLFSRCWALEDFPIENWNTSACRNFNSMFNECYRLKELDLSGWDVGLVTSIASLFQNCQSLKRVNFSGWHTGELTGIASLFAYCHCLESLDVSWLKVTDKCTSIYSAFYGCWRLKELDIPDDWDLSGLGSGSNTANSMFSACYSLERITGIKDWQFSLTNSISSMFANCRSLRELDVSGWKTDTVTSMAGMFQYCYSLEHVDLSGWETDNCTNLNGLFQGCVALKSIGDISGWDTSEVTNFSYIFADCYSLPEFPDLGSWDFSKTTTLYYAFSGMSSVKEITLTDLNLAQCTDARYTFRYCRSLERATLTGWSCPKITSQAPFYFLGDCSNLSDLEMDIPFVLNQSYAGDESLSHESLVNILNGLTTVTASRTLTLHTNQLNRLTTAEKQIATGKGWTLVAG